MRNLTVLALASLYLSAGGVAAPAADDLNPVTFGDAPDHDAVVLVKDGVPAAEIVSYAAGRMDAAAVQDLQTFIEATTGAKLPVVNEPTGKPAIVVGDCAEATAAGLIGSGMPPEGFAIKTAPGRVFIAGNGEAGTTWGVYEFLERFVDVRWYWPEYRDVAELTGASIVKRPDLVVEPASLADAPVFRKRHRYPSGGVRIGTALMGTHDRRLRAHNSWPIRLIVHAPHDWATKYRESRPDIFQLRSDGDRDFVMLCYGHPLTIQTYLDEIGFQLKAMEDETAFNPRSRIIEGTAITVSPNDMAVACRCEHCRRLWNEDGGSYGTASTVLAQFVSKLAVEVKKRWPGMTVIFLPYKNYTYAPDGVAFPDNVEVQICGMPGLAQHKDPVIDTAEQANIDKWVAMSGRKIQNWHYSCWPANRTKAAYLFPHVVRDHYLANRDKTVGSFINGVADHWPRQHVSLYCWLKVLWNPEFDVDAAINAYCRRMYGPAEKPMHELVWMLIDGWEKREWSKHSFSPKAIYEESFPRADVVKMEGLLAAAFAAAEGDLLVTRRLAYYAAPLREFFAESKQFVEGTGIRPLDMYQVAEDPVIDGRLDESGWAGFDAVAFVRATDKERTDPMYPTTLKAVWTRRGVTFGFVMSEPEPATLKRDIGPDMLDASLMWWNDNVEIFLDVTGERSGFHQFIVNPNGALYDGKDGDTSWNSTGVKAATQVGEDAWTLEVFIPIATFQDAVAPGTGVQWFGNFTRHRVTDRKAREYQRLNTTYTGSSSDQNAFGPLRFIER